MRGLLPTFGAIVLLGMAVPQVAAQEPLGQEVALAIEALPTAPIKPEIESPMFVAAVTVRCDAALRNAAGVPPAAVVHMTFMAASGVTITGPGSLMVDPQSCAQPGTTEVTLRQPYQITVPRTAPGLQAIPATAKARLDSPTTPSSAPGSPVNFAIQVDYYSLSQITMPTKLQQCRDGRAHFDIEVENLGNARTAYTFELGSEPRGRGWAAQPPESLLLDSPNSGVGSSTGTVTMHVVCDSGNKEGAYQIIIRPSAADDSAKQGDPLTANVMARSRPFDGAVPLPGAGPLLALALLGAALLVRRA